MDEKSNRSIPTIAKWKRAEVKHGARERQEFKYFERDLPNEPLKRHPDETYGDTDAPVASTQRLVASVGTKKKTPTKTRKRGAAR